MLLFVNGRYRGVECEHVGYWISDYESAFELLTQLVTDEWTLREATIIDGLDRLIVPLKAIDGQPIQEHIRTLQHQWQYLLSSNGQSADLNLVVEQQLKRWYIHMDAYYSRMLLHLKAMIASLEKRKSLLVGRPSNEQVRQVVIGQYDSLLRSNRRMYRQAKEDQQRNRIRLQTIGKAPPAG